MFTFEPDAYGPAAARLLVPRRLAELGPGAPDSARRGELRELTRERLAAGRTVRDGVMLDCCISALWLYHDFLDESHSLSQSIDTRSGSYWHGVMHRREPDYGNAKYWFRQTGRHPVFESLAAEAAARVRREPAWLAAIREPARERSAGWLAAGDAWDPFRFTDLCERAAEHDPPLAPLARELALLEWELLFDYCYRQGVGDAG